MTRSVRSLMVFPVAAVATLVSATAAHAQVPPDVEVMIREAARIGNARTVAAVTEVAKSLYPEQAEEIGKLGAQLMAGTVPTLLPPPPPIAPPVEAMIREAARDGDAQMLKAVLALARTTNPQDAKAIDELGAVLLAAAVPPPPISPEAEAMIREAGRIGDATTLASVVKVAKSNHPREEKAIEELGAKLMGEIQTKQSEAAARAREAERARLAALGAFDGWSGQGEAGIGVTTGNTDQVSALVGLKLRKEGLNARHNFAAVVDYQETSGKLSRERYALNHGLNYLLGEGLYVSTLLGWERDKFAGFARRFTESVGIGYRAINRPGMTLDIDGGPALRQTLYTSGRSENEFGARASLSYRWTMRDGITFSEDASVVTSDGSTTLFSNSAITAKFSDVISGKLSFNIQSETDPLPGRESTDTATRASIVYSF